MLLVADAALGVVVALLVLAQAVLLARVAARSFDGASLEEVTTPLVVLVAVVAARALAAWGFEVAGRRAAGDVISELRLDVVEARLRRQPAALDGAQSAEVATAAVSGVDALETTFARYLPQVVLAVVVPVAVLVLVASIDLLAAGVMLLTLPLVPVFMWLVGRQTERRARERWQALALLSNHFLDVVRGLPTLRAFNRSQAQAERIVEVSEEYRRTTMGTLRVAFLSGAVLELAATLAIALVAVVVGVRLAEGGIGFEPALTILVLTPELYLPLRNLSAQFHASADGAAVAERLLELADVPARARWHCPAARSRARADHVRGRVVPLPGARRGGAARGRPRGATRRDRRDRGAERSGEEHARLAPSLLRGALGRTDPRGRSGSRGRRPGSVATADGSRAAASDAVQGDRRRQHPPRRPVRRRRSRPPCRRARRRRTSSSRGCRRATRPSWGRGAGRSPPGSDAGSRSRARSCATRRSSSSTSRPPISIPRAPLSSPRRSSVFAPGERSCSSRTDPSSSRVADRIVHLERARVLETVEAA